MKCYRSIGLSLMHFKLLKLKIPKWSFLSDVIEGQVWVNSS